MAKLQAYPQKNSFAKKDINQFIDDVITDYCASDNLLDDRKFKFIDNFETSIRKSIKTAKKKDVLKILNKAIDDVKEIDPELHRIMNLNLRKKSKAMSKDKIEKNKKRVLKNLKQAKQIMESHPHPLSNNQKIIEMTINDVIRACEKDNEKKETMSSDKSKDLSFGL